MHFSTVQQRYVLASMMFIVEGMAWALRISFTLLLTQMVKIPNSNPDTEAHDLNGDLFCPVKHSSSRNQTSFRVCENCVKRVVMYSNVRKLCLD